MPADVPTFLDACEADSVEIFGWELWIVNHDWNRALDDKPRPAPARWGGVIPLRGKPLPGVVHGEGDLATTRAELASLDLSALTDPQWLHYVRVNFTLDDC
jgi:hypothetical protein